MSYESLWDHTRIMFIGVLQDAGERPLKMTKKMEAFGMYVTVEGGAHKPDKSKFPVKTLEKIQARLTDYWRNKGKYLKKEKKTKSARTPKVKTEKSSASINCEGINFHQGQKGKRYVMRNGRKVYVE